MKIKKESLPVLHSDPFQLQMPSEIGLVGGTSDDFYTFSLEVFFGVGGIEGRMPLFSVEDSDDGTNSPTWYCCFGLTQVPGSKAETSELRLFFENGSPLYENFTFFDCDQGLIAWWDNSDPLFHDKWSDMWPLVDSDDALQKAAKVVKELLAVKFPFREITDPVAQIPSYKPEYRERLFGCGPTPAGGV